jgi:hypothetical protein
MVADIVDIEADLEYVLVRPYLLSVFRPRAGIEREVYDAVEAAGVR